jgi:LCP family protein required for cell wall assembly
LPRFDNEGFNPKKRIDNDSRDRSVPDDENYYSSTPIDLNFNSRGSDADVRDNQNAVDINSYLDNFDNLQPPVRSARQSENDYVAEVERDYDAERRNKNAQRTSRAKPKKRRKRKLPTGKKILLSIIAIILVIVLLVVGLVNGALGRINYDDKSENQYVASSELESSSLVKNILLLGVDARSSDDDETSRADSMMLVSVDMKHRCIKMVSFLRDTWVYIPSHNGEQRLNAACTYGGYSGVVDTIEYNFGIDIDGYVVADFEMFKVLVDSIGGVEVDVTEKEANEVTSHQKRYGNVTLESGKHTLTGEQALAYCRIRKIDTDFMRTKRQRTVMQSILKGVKSSNIFTLYGMAYKSAPYIETDLTKSELERFAISAVTCLSGEMVETRVPFEGTWEYANKNGASVIAINVDKNKEDLIDFIYNKSADEIISEQSEE